MGLWGESQVSNDFPKIVDKIPDDRGWNRGKPGVNSVTLQREVSESLRICLQSSYSRLCGGNRWLPLTAFIERRQGQVPLSIYNESPTRMPRIILLDKFEFVFLIAFLLLLNNSSCSLSDTLYFENHYMTKTL